MILLIDNYDSFTYNLVQYLGELGEDVSVFRNDEITLEQIEALHPSRVVISPGPCTPSEAGISVPLVEISVPGLHLREPGAVLFTHSGLSGPAILRLSAWGARELHGLDYHFPICINWLPNLTAAALEQQLENRRKTQPAKFIINTAFPPLAARLWEALLLAADITRDTRWAALSRSARHRLMQQLHHTELQVVGKSLNKEEFVTCGGVRLAEVSFKTMESRVCPGLYLGGELLDIMGLRVGSIFSPPGPPVGSQARR